MRGIFLVSCFLGGSALLAGCREENNSPRPATEDAARITSARQWGESRSALQKRELTALPVLPFPFRMTVPGAGRHDAPNPSAH
ncbi:MAG: hypothetical protein ACLT8C_00990 [Akkermansia muciniphila]